MEKVTDWIALWKELVEGQGPFWNRKKRSEDNKDKWADRARGFDERVRERWLKPDPHREFILATISTVKEPTVLDIGAGTGAWAILMSKYVKKVTAVEPSSSMRSILEENLEKEGVENVEIIDGLWPMESVEPHDFTLASHSVYGSEDLPGFISSMTKVTRQTCFMLLRAPDSDGIMARASGRIWGHPYDSPNFQVAYNAMLQMGLFPNVLMEEKGMWPQWADESYDDAFERIETRFGVEKGSDHSDFLRELLRENLTKNNGKVVWPSELRTGLLYWSSDDIDRK